MNIGELLKKYRTERGMSQKDWCDNIVSPSYYSKVEKDEHRITAEDLIHLLNKNSIDLTHFFIKLSTKNDFELAETQLVLFSSENKVEAIKQLKEEVLQSNHFSDDEKKFFDAQADYYCYAVLDDNLDKLTDNQITLLKEHLFSFDEWTQPKLGMYANFINLYDLNTNQYLISSILQKDLLTYSYREQVMIQTILINILSNCIEENKDELAYHYLNIVNQFPTHTDNFMQKLYAKLFYYLLEYRKTGEEVNEEKIKNLSKVFQEIGTDWQQKRMLLFFEQHKIRK